MLMVEQKALEINEFAHIRSWKEDTLLNAKALFGAPVRLPDTIIFLSTLTSVCLFPFYFSTFSSMSLFTNSFPISSCSQYVEGDI